MKNAVRLLSDCRTRAEFEARLGTCGKPVVLVEGTRQVPKKMFPRLTAFGEWLARQYPAVRFRTGNASGADEAFAEGVARVDAGRLECVVPYRTMRHKQAHPAARRLALDDVPGSALVRLAQISNQVSPQYQRIVDYYLQKPGKNCAVMQAGYLLRDVLKVCGCETPSVTAATAGIFYVNESDPLGGGTGHTIRVCRAAKVPIVTQADWLAWLTTDA